jgi:1,4-alpha-glucan branching enzyme
VRFAIRAPGAERVELSGDFTGWEPVRMDREDGTWSVGLTLPPGTHHFGFLVDGQWVVPADAPGKVDDGWGRINATVVIEP